MISKNVFSSLLVFISVVEALHDLRSPVYDLPVPLDVTKIGRLVEPTEVEISTASSTSQYFVTTAYSDAACSESFASTGVLLACRQPPEGTAAFGSYTEKCPSSTSSCKTILVTVYLTDDCTGLSESYCADLTWPSTNIPISECYAYTDFMYQRAHCVSSNTPWEDSFDGLLLL
jgi:hypothetical protein